MRGHIANRHLHPLILPWFGVARFDIDLAESLNIRLDWVVKKALGYLEEGWKDCYDIEAMLSQRDSLRVVFDRLGEPWGEEWCKRMVVKNLHYIDQSQMAEVPWEKVHRTMPGSELIVLDIVRDSFDEFNFNLVSD